MEKKNSFKKFSTFTPEVIVRVVSTRYGFKDPRVSRDKNWKTPYLANLDFSHLFFLNSKIYSFVLRHLQNYPAPVGLSLSWTFGSLSLLALILQIATGLCLSMHFIPGVDVAFDSVEHIVRDVSGGHFLRYAHSNGASFYFICVYSHILRSLYFKSFIENRGPWNIGIIIFLASMAAAFLGYVLPWGQMSFWGATVITNLFSVIPFVGTDIVHFLWGGFGVGGPTLNRFYTLHFIIPLLVLVLVIFHILSLHEMGSTIPYQGHWGDDSISFFTYYIIKDIYLIGYFLSLFLLFIVYAPNYLNHPDNYNKADSMKTPPHIVPEWYFLPFYAILRAIPNKTLGVLAMAVSVVFLIFLPLMGSVSKANMGFSLNDKLIFWNFVLVSCILGFLGSMPIETPFVQMSWMFCQLYFLLGFAIGGASWLFGQKFFKTKNEIFKSNLLFSDKVQNRNLNEILVFLWLFHNSVMLLRVARRFRGKKTYNYRFTQRHRGIWLSGFWLWIFGILKNKYGWEYADRLYREWKYPSKKLKYLVKMWYNKKYKSLWLIVFIIIIHIKPWEFFYFDLVPYLEIFQIKIRPLLVYRSKILLSLASELLEDTIYLFKIFYILITNLIESVSISLEKLKYYFFFLDFFNLADNYDTLPINSHRFEYFWDNFIISLNTTVISLLHKILAGREILITYFLKMNQVYSNLHVFNYLEFWCISGFMLITALVSLLLLLKILTFSFLPIIFLFTCMVTLVTFFKLPISFADDWVRFLLDESFKNTNKFSSGNFFITNSGLGGFERYGDIQLPWGILNNSLGWGPVTKRLTQADRIREIERTFKDPIFSNAKVSRLNTIDHDYGSFRNRTNKLITRTKHLINKMQSVVGIIDKSLMSERKYSELLEYSSNLNTLLQSKYRTEKQKNLSSSKLKIKTYPQRVDSGIYIDFDGNNNFLLNSKNSVSSPIPGNEPILSEKIKTSLYDKNSKITHSVPKESKQTSNHIFEKNLQDFRSDELNAKKTLEDIIKKHLTKNYHPKSFLERSDIGSTYHERITDPGINNTYVFRETTENSYKIEDIINFETQDMDMVGKESLSLVLKNKHTDSKLRSALNNGGLEFISSYSNSNITENFISNFKNNKGLYLGLYRYNSVTGNNLSQKFNKIKNKQQLLIFNSEVDNSVGIDKIGHDVREYFSFMVNSRSTDSFIKNLIEDTIIYIDEYQIDIKTTPLNLIVKKIFLENIEKYSTYIEKNELAAIMYNWYGYWGLDALNSQKELMYLIEDIDELIYVSFLKKIDNVKMGEYEHLKEYDVYRGREIWNTERVHLDLVQDILKVDDRLRPKNKLSKLDEKNNDTFFAKNIFKIASGRKERLKRTSWERTNYSNYSDLEEESSEIKNNIREHFKFAVVSNDSYMRYISHYFRNTEKTNLFQKLVYLKTSALPFDMFNFSRKIIKHCIRLLFVDIDTKSVKSQQNYIQKICIPYDTTSSFKIIKVWNQNLKTWNIFSDTYRHRINLIDKFKYQANMVYIFDFLLDMVKINSVVRYAELSVIPASLYGINFFLEKNFNTALSSLILQSEIDNYKENFLALDRLDERSVIIPSFVWDYDDVWDTPLVVNENFTENNLTGEKHQIIFNPIRFKYPLYSIKKPIAKKSYRKFLVNYVMKWYTSFSVWEIIKNTFLTITCSHIDPIRMNTKWNNKHYPFKYANRRLRRLKRWREALGEHYRIIELDLINYRESNLIFLFYLFLYEKNLNEILKDNFYKHISDVDDDVYLYYNFNDFSKSFQSIVFSSENTKITPYGDFKIEKFSPDFFFYKVGPSVFNIKELYTNILKKKKFITTNLTIFEEYWKIEQYVDNYNNDLFLYYDPTEDLEKREDEERISRTRWADPVRTTVEYLRARKRGRQRFRRMRIKRKWKEFTGPGRLRKTTKKLNTLEGILERPFKLDPPISILELNSTPLFTIRNKLESVLEKVISERSGNKIKRNWSESWTLAQDKNFSLNGLKYNSLFKELLGSIDNLVSILEILAWTNVVCIDKKILVVKTDSSFKNSIDGWALYVENMFVKALTLAKKNTKHNKLFNQNFRLKEIITDYRRYGENIKIKKILKMDLIGDRQITNGYNTWVHDSSINLLDRYQKDSKLISFFNIESLGADSTSKVFSAQYSLNSIFSVKPYKKFNQNKQIGLQGRKDNLIFLEKNLKRPEIGYLNFWRRRNNYNRPHYDFEKRFVGWENFRINSDGRRYDIIKKKKEIFNFVINLNLVPFQEINYKISEKNKTNNIEKEKVKVFYLTNNIKLNNYKLFLSAVENFRYKIYTLTDFGKNNFYIPDFYCITRFFTGDWANKIKNLSYRIFVDKKTNKSIRILEKYKTLVDHKQSPLTSIDNEKHYHVVGMEMVLDDTWWFKNINYSDIVNTKINEYGLKNEELISFNDNYNYFFKLKKRVYNYLMVNIIPMRTILPIWGWDPLKPSLKTTIAFWYKKSCALNFFKLYQNLLNSDQSQNSLNQNFNLYIYIASFYNKCIILLNSKIFLVWKSSYRVWFWITALILSIIYFLVLKYKVQNNNKLKIRHTPRESNKNTHTALFFSSSHINKLQTLKYKKEYYKVGSYLFFTFILYLLFKTVRLELGEDSIIPQLDNYCLKSSCIESIFRVFNYFFNITLENDCIFNLCLNCAKLYNYYFIELQYSSYFSRGVDEIFTLLYNKWSSQLQTEGIGILVDYKHILFSWYRVYMNWTDSWSFQLYELYFNNNLRMLAVSLIADMVLVLEFNNLSENLDNRQFYSIKDYFKPILLIGGIIEKNYWENGIDARHVYSTISSPITGPVRLDPFSILGFIQDMLDIVYLNWSGTIRFVCREKLKNLNRYFNPWLDNIREFLAAEIDDTDTLVEDLTEEIDITDVVEDDFEFNNMFEDLPISNLSSGTAPLIVNMLEYAVDGFQVLELENIFHYISGLDSIDGSGFMEREFDINIILRSLWASEVIYYSPSFGGALLINFESLFDFVKVILLDQRGFISNNIYYLINETRYFSVKVPYYTMMRYAEVVDAVVRAYNYFFFRWEDFFDGLFLYMVYVVELFGVQTIIFTFFFLLIFGKINNAIERSFRTPNTDHFSFLKIFQIYHLLFTNRVLYLTLSNIVLFLRMTIILLLISSVLLLAVDAFRIAGISRLYIVDRGDLKYLSGTFFTVERDPFVEKHIPLDEVWDEFNYDSQIDNTYDKYHFVRKRAELFGGPVWESGAMTNASGFAKNFDWSSEGGPTNDEKEAGHQEHNRFVDENSYIPNFIERTEMEHDYIYDYETHENIDRDGIDALSSEEDEIFDDEDGSDEAEDANPKTIYEKQEIIKHELKPLFYKGNKAGLVDKMTDTGNEFDFTGQVASNNKLYNLMARKRGEMQTEPVEDSYLIEEQDAGDPEVEIGSDKVFWNAGDADPITQYNRNSLTPYVDWQLPMNFSIQNREKMFKEEAYRRKFLGGILGKYRKIYNNSQFYRKSKWRNAAARSSKMYFYRPPKKKTKKLKNKFSLDVEFFRNISNTSQLYDIIKKRKDEKELVAYWKLRNEKTIKMRKVIRELEKEKLKKLKKILKKKKNKNHSKSFFSENIVSEKSVDNVKNLEIKVRRSTNKFGKVLDKKIFPENDKIHHKKKPLRDFSQYKTIKLKKKNTENNMIDLIRKNKKRRKLKKKTTLFSTKLLSIKKNTGKKRNSRKAIPFWDYSKKIRFTKGKKFYAELSSDWKNKKKRVKPISYFDKFLFKNYSKKNLTETKQNWDVMSDFMWSKWPKFRWMPGDWERDEKALTFKTKEERDLEKLEKKVKESKEKEAMKDKKKTEKTKKPERKKKPKRHTSFPFYANPEPIGIALNLKLDRLWDNTPVLKKIFEQDHKKITGIRKKLKFGTVKSFEKKKENIWNYKSEQINKKHSAHLLNDPNGIVDKKFYYIPKSSKKKDLLLEERRVGYAMRDKNINYYSAIRRKRKLMSHRRYQKYARYGNAKIVNYSFNSSNKNLHKLKKISTPTVISNRVPEQQIHTLSFHNSFIIPKTTLKSPTYPISEYIKKTINPDMVDYEPQLRIKDGFFKKFKKKYKGIKPYLNDTGYSTYYNVHDYAIKTIHDNIPFQDGENEKSTMLKGFFVSRQLITDGDLVIKRKGLRGLYRKPHNKIKNNKKFHKSILRSNKKIEKEYIINELKGIRAKKKLNSKIKKNNISPIGGISNNVQKNFNSTVKVVEDEKKLRKKNNKINIQKVVEQQWKGYSLTPGVNTKNKQTKVNNTAVEWNQRNSKVNLKKLSNTYFEDRLRTKLVNTYGNDKNKIQNIDSRVWSKHVNNRISGLWSKNKNKKNLSLGSLRYNYNKIMKLSKKYGYRSVMRKKINKRRPRSLIKLNMGLKKFQTYKNEDAEQLKVIGDDLKKFISWDYDSKDIKNTIKLDNYEKEFKKINSNDYPWRLRKVKKEFTTLTQKKPYKKKTLPIYPKSGRELFFRKKFQKKSNNNIILEKLEAHKKLKKKSKLAEVKKKLDTEKKKNEKTGIKKKLDTEKKKSNVTKKKTKLKKKKLKSTDSAKKIKKNTLVILQKIISKNDTFGVAEGRENKNITELVKNSKIKNKQSKFGIIVKKKFDDEKINKDLSIDLKNNPMKSIIGNLPQFVKLEVMVNNFGKKNIDLENTISNTYKNILNKNKHKDPKLKYFFENKLLPKADNRRKLYLRDDEPLGKNKSSLETPLRPKKSVSVKKIKNFTLRQELDVLNESKKRKKRKEKYIKKYYYNYLKKKKYKVKKVKKIKLADVGKIVNRKTEKNKILNFDIRQKLGLKYFKKNLSTKPIKKVNPKKIKIEGLEKAILEQKPLKYLIKMHTKLRGANEGLIKNETVGKKNKKKYLVELEKKNTDRITIKKNLKSRYGHQKLIKMPVSQNAISSSKIKHKEMLDGMDEKNKKSSSFKNLKNKKKNLEPEKIKKSSLGSGNKKNILTNRGIGPIDLKEGGSITADFKELVIKDRSQKRENSIKLKTNPKALRKSSRAFLPQGEVNNTKEVKNSSPKKNYLENREDSKNKKLQGRKNINKKIKKIKDKSTPLKPIPKKILLKILNSSKMIAKPYDNWGIKIKNFNIDVGNDTKNNTQKLRLEGNFMKRKVENIKLYEKNIEKKLETGAKAKNKNSVTVKNFSAKTENKKKPIIANLILLSKLLKTDTEKLNLKKINKTATKISNLLDDAKLDVKYLNTVSKNIKSSQKIKITPKRLGVAPSEIDNKVKNKQLRREVNKFFLTEATKPNFPDLSNLTQIGEVGKQKNIEYNLTNNKLKKTKILRPKQKGIVGGGPGNYDSSVLFVEKQIRNQKFKKILKVNLEPYGSRYIKRKENRIGSLDNFSKNKKTKIPWDSYWDDSEVYNTPTELKNFNNKKAIAYGTTNRQYKFKFIDDLIGFSKSYRALKQINSKTTNTAPNLFMGYSEILVNNKNTISKQRSNNNMNMLKNQPKPYKKVSSVNKETLKVSLASVNAYPRLLTKDIYGNKKLNYFLNNTEKSYDLIIKNNIRNIISKTGSAKFRIFSQKKINSVSNFKNFKSIGFLREKIGVNAWASSLNNNLGWYGTKILTKNPVKRISTIEYSKNIPEIEILTLENLKNFKSPKINSKELQQNTNKYTKVGKLGIKNKDWKVKIIGSSYNNEKEKKHYKITTGYNTDGVYRPKKDIKNLKKSQQNINLVKKLKKTYSNSLNFYINKDSTNSSIKDSKWKNFYEKDFSLDSPETEKYFTDKLEDRFYRRISHNVTSPMWKNESTLSVFTVPDYFKRRVAQGDRRGMTFSRTFRVLDHFKKFKPTPVTRFTAPYDIEYQDLSKNIIKKKKNNPYFKNNKMFKRFLKIEYIKKNKKQQQPLNGFYMNRRPFMDGSLLGELPEKYAPSVAASNNLFKNQNLVYIDKEKSKSVKRRRFFNKSKFNLNPSKLNLRNNFKKTKILGGFPKNFGLVKHSKSRTGFKKKTDDLHPFFKMVGGVQYQNPIIGEYKTQTWAANRLGGIWNQKLKRKPNYMFNHYKTNETLFRKSILWGEGYIPYKSTPVVRRSEFSIRSIAPKERSMSYAFGRRAMWRDTYEWESSGSGAQSNAMIKKLRAGMFAKKWGINEKNWAKGLRFFGKKFKKKNSKALSVAYFRSEGLYRNYLNQNVLNKRAKFSSRYAFYNNLPEKRQSGIYGHPKLASYPWYGILLEQNFDPMYDGYIRNGNYWVTEKFHYDPRNSNGLEHFTNPSEDINSDGDDMWNLPGLSFYVVKEDLDPEMKEDVMQLLNRKFEMRDTYKKKDKFHFSPRLRVQNFLSEHTEGDEVWLQPPTSSKFFSWNTIPFNYTDPSRAEYFQPRGLHSFKVGDDDDFAQNSPYYTISDFHTGSRIRSDDLGYARVPLRHPDTQFIGDDDMVVGDEQTGYSPTEEYEKFKNRDLNFRDLWWRSIESGALTTSAQKDFAFGIMKDRDEKYRDFLLSYDYKLFGKSWLQPQYVDNPIESQSFDGEFNIVNWTAMRDDDISHNSGIMNSYENSFFGDFVDMFPHSPYAVIDGNLLFWATQLRDIIQYGIVFTWFYMSSGVGILLETYKQIPLMLFNSIFLRINNINFLIKLELETFTDKGWSLDFPVWVFKTILYLFEVVEFRLDRIFYYIYEFNGIIKNNDRSIDNSGTLYSLLSKIITFFKNTCYLVLDSKLWNKTDINFLFFNLLCIFIILII